MSKTLMLQIPTDIVRNSLYKIDDKTFVVYAYLMYKKFTSYGNELSFDHNTMKKVVNIADNRTLKKSLDKLHELRLIKKVEKLPTSSELKITVIDYEGDYKFTQLPITLLYKIHKIGHTGFRLLFYYESYINRKNITQLFCFAGFETIQSDLKMSSKTITKYNEILVKEKYLSITKHKPDVDDYLDFSRFTRYNNHYKVNIHKI